MDTTIRILHIDDNYFDGGPIELELAGLQYPASVRFVTTRAEFLDAIAHQDFDVILSDYRMPPDFGGDEALLLARAHCPDVPCILLAEPLEQELAIEALKRGAADYVLKDNLRRLVPAIEHVLSDARKSRQARDVEQRLRRLNDKLQQVQNELTESKCIQEQLRTGEEQYRRVFGSMRDPAAIFDLVYDDGGVPVNCTVLDMNPAFETLVGATKSELLGRHASDFFGEALDLDLVHSVAVSGQPGFSEMFIAPLGRHLVVAVFATEERKVVAVFTDITERKEMEEALLKNQHRLSLAQEAGKIGVFDWNVINGEVIWTAELVKLFGAGARASRYTYEDWVRVIHPDHRQQVERAIRDWLVSDRTEERLEYRITSPDGEGRWMELFARLVRDSQGRPIRVIGTNLDITERKQGEEALRKSNEKLSKVLESIHDAFYSLGRDWKFTYVNKRACELWKKKPEELIGQNIWEVFPQGTETEAYGKMERAMAGGGEETFETYSDLLKTWAHIRVYTTDEGIAVYFHDITDRKMAEESLRRSEQLYRAIGETINWGIWVCDPDGKNIYASPSFLTMVGMTQQECSEFGWGNVLHPDDAEATIAAWKERSQTGSFWERAHRFKGVDGKYHHVLARGIPVRDEKGAIVCWAGINLDIDEMMEREEEMERRVEKRTKELMQANQELESFSYSVSHDLKAPLRVISGFARLLLDGQHDSLSEKQREYLQMIRENTDQMNELVNALLTFSHVTRQVARLTQVDVRSLVENVIEQEERNGGPGASLRYAVDVRELPPVTADPVLLRQVFANLLSNAFKFTRTAAAPKIEIGSRKEKDFLVYYVRDNGVGFPAAEAKKLFHVFQRLHAQSEFEGTGVGLANVRKIIERHGGRVWAKGEEGKGATFYVALPRRPAFPDGNPHPSTTS